MIFGLIGASGTGKTTIAKYLEKKGYNVIHSYTTREERTPNEWGHTFVKENDVVFNHNDKTVCFKSINKTEKMIAYVLYNNFHYWATKEQYAGKGKSIYVIDPKGFLRLKEWNEVPIIGITLIADEQEKFYRMLARGDSEEKAKQRLQNDFHAFSCIRTDWVVNVERPLYEINDAIIKIIEQY